MLKKIPAAIASAAILASLAAAPASAALTLGSVACTSSAVTTAQPGYTGCLGSFTGNMDNQLSSIYSAIASGFGLSTNTYFASQQFATVGNPFSADAGALDNGTISFDTAQAGVFVIGLKQANAFSLYRFDGSLVAGGISSISYDSNGVKKNGGTILSHAGFFGSPVSAVPEADTYAMLLAGLGMIGFIARRRKAQ
ncbi:PEP-CTERM sorting domain-containing protein [Janthinobacterium fluminis]|uniref:PEP-CTERM sorting domain-containing protein n=1 Tax=Janthinobacterium fluminis TaxID=2987524 RepID=A0ABT5K1A7_9BURK|nr:PEP-CTERM sorting domain-containing protein [Janthinobacterium fluminis]MDC8758460.1 PEP-CTERM sorting domain-containing protein [Janthinobacterium fluminis]